MEKIGTFIARKRKEAKISQTELGMKAGLTQTYVSLIEGNKLVPSMESLGQIVKSLDISAFKLTWVNGVTRISDYRRVIREPINQSPSMQVTRLVKKLKPLKPRYNGD